MSRSFGLICRPEAAAASSYTLASILTSVDTNSTLPPPQQSPVSSSTNTLEDTGDCCGGGSVLLVSTEVRIEARVYEDAAAASGRQIEPKLRDIARFCVNTFRVFYAAGVGTAFTSVAAAAAAVAAGPATASTCPDGLAAQEASPRDPVMGNLQSETKKKGKKAKGAVDGTASTSGSIADGLDDTTDTGDDGKTAETQETPTKNGRVEEWQKTGPEKRLHARGHRRLLRRKQCTVWIRCSLR